MLKTLRRELEVQPMLKTLRWELEMQPVLKRPLVPPLEPSLQIQSQWKALAMVRRRRCPRCAISHELNVRIWGKPYRGRDGRRGCRSSGCGRRSNWCGRRSSGRWCPRGSLRRQMLEDEMSTATKDQGNLQQKEPEQLGRQRLQTQPERRPTDPQTRGSKFPQCRRLLGVDEMVLSPRRQRRSVKQLVGHRSCRSRLAECLHLHLFLLCQLSPDLDRLILFPLFLDQLTLCPSFQSFLGLGPSILSRRCPLFPGLECQFPSFQSCLGLDLERQFPSYRSCLGLECQFPSFQSCLGPDLERQFPSYRSCLGLQCPFLSYQSCLDLGPLTLSRRYPLFPGLECQFPSFQSCLGLGLGLERQFPLYRSCLGLEYRYLSFR
jgi:hypothetical protein